MLAARVSYKVNVNAVPSSQVTPGVSRQNAREADSWNVRRLRCMNSPPTELFGERLEGGKE